MAPEPVLARSLHKEIEGIIASLVTRGLSDDQEFTVVRSRHGGWHVEAAAMTYAHALKKRPYAEIYGEMRENRAFNIQMLDGALIQLSYSGVEERLTRHRLAYLPSPTLEPFQNNPDLYIGEEVYADVVGHQVVPVPIRLDFDPDAARDLVHPAVHATLGQYRHCRIPVTRPTAPGQFVEMILHAFYTVPDAERIVLERHSPVQDSTITEEEQQGLHLAV